MHISVCVFRNQGCKPPSGCQRSQDPSCHRIITFAPIWTLLGVRERKVEREIAIATSICDFTTNSPHRIIEFSGQWWALGPAYPPTRSTPSPRLPGGPGRALGQSNRPACAPVSAEGGPIYGVDSSGHAGPVTTAPSPPRSDAVSAVLTATWGLPGEHRPHTQHPPAVNHPPPVIPAYPSIPRLTKRYRWDGVARASGGRPCAPRATGLARMTGGDSAARALGERAAPQHLRQVGGERGRAWSRRSRVKQRIWNAIVRPIYEHLPGLYAWALEHSPTERAYRARREYVCCEDCNW